MSASLNSSLEVSRVFELERSVAALQQQTSLLPGLSGQVAQILAALQTRQVAVSGGPDGTALGGSTQQPTVPAVMYGDQLVRTASGGVGVVGASPTGFQQGSSPGLFLVQLSDEQLQCGQQQLQSTPLRDEAVQGLQFDGTVGVTAGTAIARRPLAAVPTPLLVSSPRPPSSPVAVTRPARSSNTRLSSSD